LEDLREFGDPGSPDFHVDNYPFYLLNRAVSRYNVIIEGELKRIGLDIPTWRVLMVLGENAPRAVNQIAKAAVINISTMIRIVERMTLAGLIETAKSGIDGRVTDLALTELGQEKLAAARILTAPLYRKVIRGFSARDFNKLLDMLNRLHANLE
jgi:DNA-binding MarR family transcriptional regulator